MAEPLAGQPGGESASAPAPAAPVDIERLKAELTAAAEERFKGFQRLLAGRDKTIEALTGELEEFKTAGLSEDERAQLRENELKEENERLRTELELQGLAREYGDEYPIFREILDAPTARDQLDAIRRLRSATTQAASSAPAPAAPASSPVDMNNPIRREEGILLPDGTPMSDDIADRVLRSFSKVPWRAGAVEP